MTRVSPAHTKKISSERRCCVLPAQLLLVMRVRSAIDDCLVITLMFGWSDAWRMVVIFIPLLYPSDHGLDAILKKISGFCDTKCKIGKLCFEHCQLVNAYCNKRASECLLSWHGSTWKI
jgi:hypothetical protein